MNEKFHNALARKEQAIPPIWMMRQAGRYHSHYQGMRKDNSFMDLCKKADLAAEVAMGPIRDFDFDVAILFSDLLFPLEAIGMGLSYGDGGPKLGWHLNPQTINEIKNPDDALPALQFQQAAVEKTREVLPDDKSLIGFVGGPWTLFVYATAGSHKGNLAPVHQNMPLFKPFCETMVPLLKKNIQLQLDGGAEKVMLFDTAAGEISPYLYHEMVLPSIIELAETFPGKLGYYAKNIQTTYYDHDFFRSGTLAGLGFDHKWQLSDAFKVSETGFVQGNFHELLLTQDESEFKKHVDVYIQRMKQIEDRRGWVCGLGHGIIPQAKENNVRYFIKTIREQL